ncbi:MAG: hypothetical protein MUD16_11585 [Desulfobacterales bacterium]|jgi:hypothetical protein|nr:hypothetical protein [Desulfobacterales bacterium]
MHLLLRTMAILLCIGAGSATAGGPPPAVDKYAGKPGVVVTDVLEVRAVVEAIDPAKRLLKLKGSQGRSFSLKADASIKNLQNIKRGDRVRVDLIESIAVSVRRSDQPPNAAEARLVSVAPKGAKPAILLAETVQMAAVVEAVDLKAHALAIRERSGARKTVAVDRSFKKLGEIRKGEDVILRMTEALAIRIEKTK